MPETCPTCNAIRTGVDDLRVVFACGAILDDDAVTRACGRVELGDLTPDVELAELPPDVSGLRYEDKEVEIAEPRKRLPVRRGELVLGEHFVTGKPLNRIFKVEHCSACLSPRWILRIKEPQSVYGMDPKLVDLSQLRGPRDLPVEWVDFREPRYLELVIGSKWSQQPFKAVYHRRLCPIPDKRRIIVREVEPRKPRRWVAEICSARPCDKADQEHIRVGVSQELATLRPLADLDDPKVLGAICPESSLSPTAKRQLIEAYLALPAHRDGRAGE